MSFAEVIADAAKKQQEAAKYVQETGLCCACKKNPVAGSPDSLRCSKCVEETEKLLRQLRGPGFVEARVGR
jgi:hypothetical protein